MTTRKDIQKDMQCVNRDKCKKTKKNVEADFRKCARTTMKRSVSPSMYTMFDPAIAAAEEFRSKQSIDLWISTSEAAAESCAPHTTNVPMTVSFQVSNVGSCSCSMPAAGKENY